MTSTTTAATAAGPSPVSMRLTPQEQMEWDQPLIYLAQKSNGDLRKLFTAFFGFLHRRTDFYMIRNPNDEDGGKSGGGATAGAGVGFKEGDAEQMLLACFRQFPLRRMPTRKDMEERSNRRRMMEEEEKKKKKESSDMAKKQSSSTKKTTTTTTTTKKECGASVTKKKKKKGEKEKEGGGDDDADCISSGKEEEEDDASSSSSSAAGGEIKNPSGSGGGEGSEGEQRAGNDDVCDEVDPTATTPAAKGDDGDKSKEGNDEANTPTSSTTTTNPPPPPLMMARVRRTLEGKQIPVGNGGSTSTYTWTQTLTELSIIVPLPLSSGGDGRSSVRGKDLDVVFRPKHITVKLKNDSSSSKVAMLLEGGELSYKIQPSESTWTIESNTLLLTLEKLPHSPSRTWWEKVFVHEVDVIDTTLVDSRRNINTYDEATQGRIRQIIFDQNRERDGLPTSEDILLGKKKSNIPIPPLPPPTTTTKKNLPEGVEFIDRETLEKANKG